MYQKIKRGIAFLTIFLVLCCSTVFAAEPKGYLLPEESYMLDRSDLFVAILNNSLLAGYDAESGLQNPLLINFREVETVDNTLLYQGEWGAATMAIFADKQTQRLQSVALILPKDYVLNGYTQEGLDYFASIGILSGFFNGANANGIEGSLLREQLDFFNFDFYTLQSQHYEIGNLDYYYEVGTNSITFIVTGIPSITQW